VDGRRADRVNATAQKARLDTLPRAAGFAPTLVLVLSCFGASCSDEIKPPEAGVDASDAGTVDVGDGVDAATSDVSPDGDADLGTSDASPDGAGNDAHDDVAGDPAVPDAAYDDAGCAATCTGKCFGERCAVVLAPPQVHPYAVAVNATHLYWTTAVDQPGTSTGPGTLMRVPTAGGPPEELALDLVTPHHIVLDDTSVYWTSFAPVAGGLLKMPLGKGPVTAIAANQDNCHGLVVAGSTAYFTNYSEGTVKKAPIDGHGPITQLAGGQPCPTHVAVDATYLYWTNQVSPNGSIMRLPLAGGVPEPFLSNQAQPYGVVVDATNIYWTNTAGGTVMQMPLAGGAPITLAKGQVSPYSLVVDEGNVYFTTFDGGQSGTIMKVPIGGGAPEAKLADATSYNIAVDATSVYYTTFNAGGVLRLTPK
jgi:hypothetical protein